MEPDDLKTAIKGLKDVPLLTGNMTMDPATHIPIKDVTLIRMNGTTQELVQTEDAGVHPGSVTLLEVDDLSVRYGPLVALHGVRLRVEAGEIVTVLGANGAGKSSLLGAVAGLVPAAAGRIVLDGKPIANLPAERVVRLGIALAPEGRRVFPRLTVADNLRLGAAARRDRDGIAADRARVLELFPVLEERLWQSAGTLSGGQQQMLAIARSLMSRPRLLLLDEPSLGLAPIVVDQIFGLIARLRDEGTTILLVEQNVAPRARPRRPRVRAGDRPRRGRGDGEGGAGELGRRAGLPGSPPRRERSQPTGGNGAASHSA